MQGLHENWKRVLKQTDLHTNLLEPFIAFRTILLRVLNSIDSMVHHLRESAAILRKVYSRKLKTFIRIDQSRPAKPVARTFIYRALGFLRLLQPHMSLCAFALEWEKNILVYTGLEGYGLSSHTYEIM